MNKYVLEGEYLEILVELLGERYKVDSLIKLVFMAFCIKNIKKTAFIRRKKDFVDVFLSSLDIKLLSHPDDIKAILEVIHKLKTSGWIKVEDDVIEVIRDFGSLKGNNEFLSKFREKVLNPIEEVNRLDNRAFAEEVLRHV